MRSYRGAKIRLQPTHWELTAFSPELPKLDYRGLFVRLWEGKKKARFPQTKIYHYTTERDAVLTIKSTNVAEILFYLPFSLHSVRVPP